METGARRIAPHAWIYSVTAGFEAGILGGLVLVGWLLLVADWQRQTPWTVLNLFGGAFYPELSFRIDYSQAALPGLALVLFSSGCTGILFGLMVAPIESVRRRVLFGFLISLCWFYLSFALCWKRYNPPLFHYAGREMFLVGHLLLGAMLGLQPQLADSLSRSFGAGLPVPVPPEPADPVDGSRIQ